MPTSPGNFTSITVVPAGPGHWPDLKAFFANFPCTCQYWRLTSSEYGRGKKEDLPAKTANLQALLRGAIACAREYGAPALEAYPIDPEDKRVSGAFAYVGTVSMFEREGFTRVLETDARSASLSRWLMRLDL